MTSAFSIFCIIYFLLQVIFVHTFLSESSIIYDNETIDTVPWKSGRVKRFILTIDVLRLRIRFEDGRITSITLTKQNQLLANENLDVTLPLLDHKPNIMKNVGKFMIFQDAVKCTTLVFFANTNSFYGVIGTDYYVDNLPQLFDAHGYYLPIVDIGVYVHRRQNPPSHNHPNNIFTSLPNRHGSKNYLNPLQANETQTKNTYDGSFRITRTYYFEILIFVARDIVQIFINHFGQEHYVEWLLRYYIVYFSCVDMTIKMALPNTLYLNIAKIIIEDDLLPFNFMSNGDLQINDIISKLPPFLNIYNLTYPPDSFDYVFIHTSRSLWDFSTLVNAFTKHGFNLYDARKTNHFYDVVPITAMVYKNSYADYILAAHEIGRVFDMKIDPEYKGINLDIGQCYGIMQRNGAKCAKCLKWSDESQRQLLYFLLNNQNRCFYLNFPRSLRPPSPSKLIRPNDQCTCFGYNSYRKNARNDPIGSVSTRECSTSLYCKVGEKFQSGGEYTTIPFDGTPCGRNRKVCWNRGCVNADML